MFEVMKAKICTWRRTLIWSPVPVVLSFENWCWLSRKRKGISHRHIATTQGCYCC